MYSLDTLQNLLYLSQEFTGYLTWKAPTMVITWPVLKTSVLGILDEAAENRSLIW